jgi:hypothetical protein
MVVAVTVDETPCPFDVGLLGAIGELPHRGGKA